MENQCDPIADGEIQPATLKTNDVGAPAPWEMIEPGRYQPKRTRGSCVGRELG